MRDVRFPDRRCAHKARYSTRRLARTVAARREGEGAPILHVYECRACAGWHLSRTSPAEYAARGMAA